MSKYNFSNFKSENTNPKDIYKRTVYKYPTRGVISNGVGDIFSVDLIDLSKKPSNGYKFILNCVDVASRKLWSFPLKKKDNVDLMVEFATLFSYAKPKKIWSDRESALISNDFKTFFKNHGVEIYHTYGYHSKSSIVERLNRTMAEKMRENTNNFKDWEKFNPAFVEEYNRSIHSSTGVSPNDAWNKKDKGQAQQRNIEHYTEKRPEPKINFNVGDKVRLQIKKAIFTKKSHTPNFTTEIYTIEEVKKTIPTTYIIKKANGENVVGSYYKQQLLKV